MTRLRLLDALAYAERRAEFLASSCPDEAKEEREEAARLRAELARIDQEEAHNARKDISE